MEPCRSTASVAAMHVSSPSPFTVKTFATIVLAVCILSQFASSAEWNDLSENDIGEIAKNLLPGDKLRFASTSRAVKNAVDVSPKEILTGIIDIVMRKSERYRFYDAPRKLEATTVSNVPVDDFVMVKSSDHIYVPDDRLSFIAKLGEMKDAILTEAKSDSREKISLGKEGRVSYMRMQIIVYANFHKYNPSDITACINDAYARIKKECVDGAMVNHHLALTDPPDVHVLGESKYDRKYMEKSCSSYSFMCGISYVS